MAAKGVSDEAARELGLRAARLFEQLPENREENRKRAEARYAAVLAVDPENAVALEALDRIYREQGAAKQLVEILERRGDLEFDLAVKKRFLGEVARLQEDRLAG